MFKLTDTYQRHYISLEMRSKVNNIWSNLQLGSEFSARKIEFRLKFFAKISMSSPGDHKNLMDKLQTDLFKGMEEEAIQYVLDYFDFRAWLERKSG